MGENRPQSRGASPMMRQSPSGNLGRSPSGNIIAPVAQPMSARSAAGKYVKGDQCEFWSNSHGDWLPATILNTDGSGRIQIDLKPNTWLSKEEQSMKLRPRRGAGAAERPASLPRRPSSGISVGGSPQLPRPPMQRSPSWGNYENRAASPANRAMTPLRAPSPSGRAATPTGRGATPRSRAGSRDPPIRGASPHGYGVGGLPRPPRVSQSPLRAGGALITGM
jgi:hypothetical protein